MKFVKRIVAWLLPWVVCAGLSFVSGISTCHAHDLYIYMDNERIEDFEQYANSESINDYYAELTILHWAVMRGKHDYIERILAYRPDVDALSKGDRIYMANVPMEGSYTPLLIRA